MRFVCASEPQFPLKAFLKPCSTILSLKKDLKLDSIKPIKLSLYLFSFASLFSLLLLPLFVFISFVSFLDNVSSSL